MTTKYMTVREAAQYTGFSESYLAKLRMDEALHLGPRFLRVGQRSVRYRQKDLDLWMAAKSCGTAVGVEGYGK